MTLKDSLKELEIKEKINLKREVKKELTKIKKEKKYKCIICMEESDYYLKGTNDYYCKKCALEHFSNLGHLKKIRR
ncbi:MAG: hypothetical protein KatS3mg002_1137 [Candidatus Woesearchaeota archaeon]|nr:MAG: hypothetical protein KatS3mg002_1137 [Candidatus Woesearchaeota archaeon]